jgi:hypothetical protein
MTGMGMRFGTTARLVVGASALALAIGLAGCGSNPVQQAGEAVTGVLDQVDEVSVQVAATQAMTAVLTYTLANQHLPASLADAGFAIPDGMAVTLRPAAGTAFSVCASSGDHAFKAENGAVTAVPSC